MIKKFFHGLRGKLILTYTAVTVLALLALEVLVLIFGLFLTNQLKADLRAYLSDVISLLNPMARVYLQPGEEDIAGLQGWLDDLYDSGKASLDAQGWFDSPAAMIVKSDPMYVLSTDRVVLAQTPRDQYSLVGRTYTPPDISMSQSVLDNAYEMVVDPLWISTKEPGGGYFMAVPIFVDRNVKTLVGVVVLSVEAPPSMLTTVWPFVVTSIIVTGGLLLIAVAPLGALFGLVMSRGLTRRLRVLTEAADAWGAGDFSVQPQDKARDEISYLAVRMKRMAERVQNLLQSQQELVMLEERNRLARELHDTVKQQTFATLMQVRAAKNLAESNPGESRQHLEEAETLLKTSQQDLSRMIAELRPAALEGQGLAEALNKFITNWSQQACIPANLHVQNERRLPLATELTLYRIAQEALANVARHSRASEVNVQLTYGLDQATLTISDNGVGFDPHKLPKGAGFGLVSMQERLAVIGGWAVIDSGKDRGTTVTVVAPAIQKEE